jgi:hypothetical protein
VEGTDGHEIGDAPALPVKDRRVGGRIPMGAPFGAPLNGSPKRRVEWVRGRRRRYVARHLRSVGPNGHERSRIVPAFQSPVEDAAVGENSLDPIAAPAEGDPLRGAAGGGEPVQGNRGYAADGPLFIHDAAEDDAPVGEVGRIDAVRIGFREAPQPRTVRPAFPDPGGKGAALPGRKEKVFPVVGYGRFGGDPEVWSDLVDQNGPVLERQRDEAALVRVEMTLRGVRSLEPFFRDQNRQPSLTGPLRPFEEAGRQE